MQKKNHDLCVSAIKKQQRIRTRIIKRETQSKADLKVLITPPKKTVALPIIVKKVVKKVVKKHKPKFVNGKRIIRVRRGRGNVWLQDRFGKWVNLNVQGIFSYLKDTKNQLQIYTQFAPLRLGSVISGIIVKAGKTIIKAEENGEVTVNGRQVQFNGAKIVFKNGLLVSVTKNTLGTYDFIGLHKELLSFRYFRKLRSYDIKAFSRNSKGISGLYEDPRHPKRYVIKRSEKIFDQYVDYDKITNSSGNKQQLKQSTKCCKKVVGYISRNQCMKDYFRTDMCFAGEYVKKI